MGEGSQAYFSIFIALVHPVVTLVLRYDLTRIFDDNLIGLKCPISSYAIAAVDGLHHFDTDAILSSAFVTLLQACKAAVGAVLGADVAVAVVALIEHEAVEAVFIAAFIGLADACRVL